MLEQDPDRDGHRWAQDISNRLTRDSIAITLMNSTLTTNRIGTGAAWIYPDFTDTFMM